MNAFIETLNQWGGNFLNFAWPMLWQSSLLIVALFAFDFLFRRKIRASIRYALWLVVLVKLCVPPTLAFPTSPAWWLDKTPPPAIAKPATTHFTVTYGNEPLIPQNPPPAFAPPKPAMTYAAWLLVSSAAISSALLFWLLARWWQITRQARRAPISERLTGIAVEAQKSAGTKFKVQVKLTTNSMSPAVCGLFRPVILIPQSLAENFSDEQLRAVLLHELIHLQRRDVWLNFAQALLQIFYWWHPLLWLANARIRRVREESVDDAVMLALRDGAESYAPTLLEVAKLALNRPLASLGLVGILESRHALRQRIERLVDFRPPRKAGLTLVSFFGILAFTAVAVPMGGAPEQTTNTTLSDGSDNLNQTNLTASTPAGIPGRTNSFEEKVKAVRQVQDAKLLYEMGKLDEAEKLLKSTLALDSEYAAAKYYLVLVQSARQSPEIIQTNSGRKEIVAKLNQIHLDQFGPFDGLPLDQVVKHLSETLKQAGIHLSIASGSNSLSAAMIDPSTGMPIKQSKPAAADAPPVKIHLFPAMENVSLVDALKAVTSGASQPIKFSILEDGIVFSKGASDATLLFQRTFKLDTRRFVAFFKQMNGVDTSINETTNSLAAISMAARKYFSSLGVDFESPKGKSVFYNDRLGLLFVRATQSDLDTIERALSALDQVEPQIHIKARFLEVPRERWMFVKKNLALTNSADGNTVSVLTEPNAAVAMNILHPGRGFETLAEPEVVTISGRQTQMRATRIINVITNFAFRETSTNSIVTPQSDNVECGPILDTIPLVLSDGYMINLTITASVTEFLGYDQPTNTTTVFTTAGEKVNLPVVLPAFYVQQATANLYLWDGQTVVLGKLQKRYYVGGKEVSAEPDYFVKTQKTKGQPDVEDKEMLVFITATIVDPAGNRIHTDDDLPFAKEAIPPQ